MVRPNFISTGRFTAIGSAVKINATSGAPQRAMNSPADI